MLRKTAKYKCLRIDFATSVNRKTKAGNTEFALRGYQRIQQNNLKEALKDYFASLFEQAATVSVDWWDKLKPFRIGTKGKKVPQYFKPIPGIVDEFGM